MSLGSNIKEFRLKQKLKQSELAEKAGISRVAIGNYERDERVPNAEILLKIADALNVTMIDLMNLSPNDYNLIDDIAKKAKTHPAYITGETKEKEFRKYYLEALIKDLDLNRFKQIVDNYTEYFQKSIFTLWGHYLSNMIPECYYNEYDSEFNSDEKYIPGNELDKVYFGNTITDIYSEFRDFLYQLTYTYSTLDAKFIQRDIDKDDILNIYEQKEKILNKISALLDITIQRFISNPQKEALLYSLEIIDQYGTQKEGD